AKDLVHRPHVLEWEIAVHRPHDLPQVRYEGLRIGLRPHQQPVVVERELCHREIRCRIRGSTWPLEALVRHDAHDLVRRRHPLPPRCALDATAERILVRKVEPGERLIDYDDSWRT